MPEQMREREDGGIHVRAIRRGALAIVGGIAFAVAGSWWLLRVLGPTANTAPPPAAIPAPRLQPAPQNERAAYFAEKARRLESYGWVDRKAGIAHIPLDEAMRLMAAQKSQKQQEQTP
jgi:hypothetical protein